MYLYELPTTGAISFADFCTDHSGIKAYTHYIPQVTEARANLRGFLKENKRTEDHERDYLSLIKLLEEYIPYIRALIECVGHDEIILKTEPIFSWRTTLSSKLFHNSPRLDLPGLYADYSFVLLTYGFAFCDLAHSIVTSVGAYEHDRTISDSERKAKEGRLNLAVDFLCRASGIFTHICDKVLPEWQSARGIPGSSLQRPPDLSREVNAALAKMSLADAQTLAIRRLLSKAVYDNNVAPGPPLPKSHPLPSTLAKLHIECASLYLSSKLLAKTPGATKGSSSDATKEVSSELRRYLGNQATLHSALSHKWLGVEAGEQGGSQRGGEAVAFLQWAKKELEELKDGGKLVSFGSADKEKEEHWKADLNNELTSVNAFHKYYKKMNDTLHFQPVPTQKDLQSRIPGGRIAMSAKPYHPPAPAFGPGSVEHTRRMTEQLDISTSTNDQDHHSNEDGRDEELQAPSHSPATAPPPVSGTYAGAGAYF